MPSATGGNVSLQKEGGGSKKGVWSEGCRKAKLDYFLFDSWFSSNKPTEADIDVGADIIGMVKT